MGALTVLIAMLLTVSCAADHAPNASVALPPTESPSIPTTSSVSFESSGCPVADDVFCTTATEVANAFATRDADKLLLLSRSGTIVCREMAAEYFPGCKTQDVLDGYGLSGPDLLVEIVAESAYLDKLRATTEGIDPAYTDELGDGSVRILGVGTCGPNSPGQRTYHLAWTTALSEGEAPATRVVGSFELTFEEDWRIALFYVGTLDRWEAEQPDPLNDSFCQAGQSPWRE